MISPSKNDVEAQNELQVWEKYKRQLYTASKMENLLNFALVFLKACAFLQIWRGHLVKKRPHVLSIDCMGCSRRLSGFSRKYLCKHLSNTPPALPLKRFHLHLISKGIFIGLQKKQPKSG
ncbi:hypothetical protein [Oscillibacter sp.]|uniref:hypothetical protein n=1 Tax=Oscillibacter sp. TaxID=1945593 RepID=UPI00289A87F7|nr:hypothetical protein [Oscillibacter sp.]